MRIKTLRNTQHSADAASRANRQGEPLPWWKRGSLYQVVVPSFQDADGDGTGDLQGITQRLDYLQWLGVRGIWLTPFYPSPLEDMGYDVTNYKDVHRDYGSLEDFDRLVAEAHRRDLRIVLDWVANHTSSQHPWFLESRSSRSHPKRDWYLWRDPRPDGSPPNNWISNFGGSVWQWDEPTGQYYMHSFLPSQPDLNWRHGDVQRAMFDVLRFWLDRGVDGFRIDATSLIIKDDEFRDNPPNPGYRPGQDLPDAQLVSKYTRNQPLVHDILAECRRLTESYGRDVLLAGELHLRPIELIPYYGSPTKPELHLPCNLLMPWTPWTKEALSELIWEYERRVPDCGWSTWNLNSHDSARFARRVSTQQAPVAAMLLYTLPGTPIHYYGEELGMEGLDIPPEHSVDPQGRRTGRNRDSARTPMQWTADRQAGFTAGDPWLPMGTDATTANVAVQAEDPTSILSLYRRLIALRNAEPALRAGIFLLVDSPDSLLVYRRRTGERHLLVVLNLQDQPCDFQLEPMQRGTILLASMPDREGEVVQQGLNVGGNEGVIVAVD